MYHGSLINVGYENKCDVQRREIIIKKGRKNQECNSEIQTMNTIEDCIEWRHPQTVSVMHTSTNVQNHFNTPFVDIT